MKFWGLLVLINILGITAYFLFYLSFDTKKVIAFSTLGICAALGLLIVDRITTWKSPFGDISAQVNQVKTDADEINKIREQIEKQKNTIDLVVRDANSAREKLDDLDNIVQTANTKLTEITAASDFTLLFAKAQNDDRAAFEEIQRIADIEGPFQKLAYNQYLEIVTKLSINVSFNNEPTFNWNYYKISPESSSLEEIKKIYNIQPGLLKVSILKSVWDKNRFTKYDRLEFLYDVIKSDPSLYALQKACRLMTSEAKINANFSEAKEFLLWWENNKVNYLDK